MSFYLVHGRFEDGANGRELVLQPSLDDVELEGATVHLLYSYETCDQPNALARAVEATEAWSQRGAAVVRAIPHRLPQSWPDGTPGRPGTAARDCD